MPRAGIPVPFLAMRATTFLLVFAVLAWGRSVSAAPNVVVLIADDLGWGDISAHDSDYPTPGIDRLLSEGVECTSFHAWPACMPSRFAFFTGRRPERYGIWPAGFSKNHDKLIPDKLVTIAESFQSAGYDTAMMGKWGFGETQPEQHGFDLYFGKTPGIRHWTDKWRIGGRDYGSDEYSADAIGKIASRWISARGSAPYFLVASFSQPHYPLEAPQEYVNRVPDKVEDREARIYGGMIIGMDDAIQSILDAVGDSDTIVVFFSDNGATLNAKKNGKGSSQGSNGEFRGGKHDVYQGGVQTVACLRWPGQIAADTRYDGMMSVMDLYATLTSMCGFASGPDTSFDHSDELLDDGLGGGALMAPATVSAARAYRRVLRLLFPPRDQLTWGNDFVHPAALRTPRWKLVFNAKTNLFELYDMESDPFELEDLSATDPGRVDAMKWDLKASFTKSRGKGGNGGGGGGNGGDGGF